ncbi:MAG: serine hydrolase, partial [Blastocatellia bacterium]
GDSLMTQATGQPKFELFPESETRFFLKVVEAQVTFVKDDKGAVTHLILHQGGDQKAKKIK